MSLSRKGILEPARRACIDRMDDVWSARDLDIYAFSNNLSMSTYDDDDDDDDDDDTRTTFISS